MPQEARLNVNHRKYMYLVQRTCLQARTYLYKERVTCNKTFDLQLLKAH